MTEDQSSDEAAKARAESLVGRVISDRYRIVELVAMGGMGAVYKGEHLRMRKRIAIKVLHPDIEGLPELVARFEREAVAGAHLSHPNAAAATDFGELDDGSTYLVLEYVAGRTLRAAIDAEGPFSIPRAVRIARQLASALAATHAAGIVHRDVKPRNVMLVEDTDDAVKLIDFGLAKVTVDRLAMEATDERGRRATGPLTGEGVLLGTVAYLAPEAAAGMGAVDESSDLYALGLILYEMLAGKHPFEAKSPGALFKQQRFDPPRPIAERAPGVEVPAAIEAIATRLLEKDKRKRFPSGDDVVKALDAAVEITATPKPVTAAAAPAEDSSGDAERADEAPVDESPAEADGADARPAPHATAARRPRSRTSVAAAFAGFAAVAAALTFLARPSRPAGDAPAEAPRAAMPAPGPAPRPHAAVAAAHAAPAPEPPSEPTAVATETAPAASASAAPARAVDARAARAMLLGATEAKDWRAAETSLLDLVDAQPAAFRDPNVAQAAKDVAAALQREGAAKADPVFEALSARLGEVGLDLLYELLETRGGSLAGKRAAVVLATPDVLARATPALRIAVELRAAPCDAKAALFDRAAAEGDGRTLLVLETLARSCLGKDAKLDATIASLHARLRAHAP